LFFLCFVSFLKFAITNFGQNIWFPPKYPILKRVRFGSFVSDLACSIAANSYKSKMTFDIRFLIGVDGGGTSCRAAIATPDGQILGRAQTGSSNITTNLEGATRSILDAVRNAILAAGLPSDSAQFAAAHLGLAGATVGDFAQRLSAALPFAVHQIGGDAPIALQGALGNNDGAIAILGTGSAFLARKGDKTRLIGGWGFHLSDLGGGARLGREALEMVLLAHDGIQPQTSLTAALLAQFDSNPDNLVLFAKSANAADYGRFAPLIVSHLAQQDQAAQQLLKSAANAVDAAFDALNLDAGDKIALLGGLAPHYPAFLAPRHVARLVAPKADALTGAIELAGKLATGAPQTDGGRI
jgi:glucosamine kinase